MRFGSFMACAAVAPLLTAAAQPVRLQPSSQWIIDYAENSCRMGRTFGQGDSKTLLLFDSESPGDMDMLVTGYPLKTSAEEVSARFLPVQLRMEKGRAVKTADKQQPAAFYRTVRLMSDAEAAKLDSDEAKKKAMQLVRPPAADREDAVSKQLHRQEFAASAVELEIDARRDHPVILETGSLAQPMKLFDKCSRDSLRDWGVDPDLEDKIVKPVWVSDESHWLSSEDYPAAMLDEGEQSEVKARLFVDATGRVTKCTSLSHFKAPGFSEVVCAKLSKNARFEPAELADGTKVPSYYTAQIVFRIAE